MVNEEEYLKEKMGRGTPFTVPDGYFDQLAERIMQQVPTEKRAVTKRLRPWLYAAACAGVVALSATLLFKSAPSPSAQDQKQIAMATQTEAVQEAYADYSDTYVEDAANYAMIDNEEIYAYLADI